MFSCFIIITNKKCTFVLHTLCYCIWSFVFSFGFYVSCLELNLRMSFQCSFHNSCVRGTTNYGFKFSFTFHIITIQTTKVGFPFIVMGWQFGNVCIYCSQLINWLKVGLPLILKLIFFLFEQLSLMVCVKVKFQNFLCLGIDCASTFQRVKYGITISMRTKQVFQFIRIHCMAHITNFMIHNLSIMLMVSKLEDLL